ncbi:MAG: ATP-dependent zinc metalloprotease FtsH [Bacteroidia bacterium]|nr:ATP-dependent zinc metalloprotease FtsH [Bacteroidia bacterium]
MEEAQTGIPGDQEVTVTYSEQTNWFGNLLVWGVTFFFFLMLWMLISRRMASSGRSSMGSGSLFNFGKTKAQLFEKGKKSPVTFENIAGLQEAKEEIMEIVKFLKNPKKFTDLGAKIPRGVLLVGPPGTGKTLLARAVAGEAGVPFFSTSGSEFIEMFVGVGASRIRDLFQKAKKKSPSIIFIDEIDTIGKSRDRAQYMQTNDEREGTLNQLLAELDGFDASTGVIVIGATNRADIIDSALTRPGRFDRHIHLELPTQKERVEIFRVHLSPLRLAGDVMADDLAAQTPGFSGADIANVCNEAALIAARKDKKQVFKEDFLNAIERIIGGLERRSKIITPEEKKVVAYHESGHAVASWYLKHAHPLIKVSIIPRGRSLGAAWYMPDERQIATRSKFIDMICAALGGRAAEELFFKEVSSNALDDLSKVTKQAYSMVVNYGLSEKLPNLSFFDPSGRSEQGFQRPYSEQTAQIIDEEVQDLIQKAYDRTKKILWEHREELEDLARLLLKKEVVYKEDLRKIFRSDKVAENIPSS